MTSNLFIPLITIPTKLNKNNDTLIDNISFNQYNADTISGNLTVNISDGHLPSFMITPSSSSKSSSKESQHLYKIEKFWQGKLFPWPTLNQLGWYYWHTLNQLGWYYWPTLNQLGWYYWPTLNQLNSIKFILFWQHKIQMIHKSNLTDKT